MTASTPSSRIPSTAACGSWAGWASRPVARTALAFGKPLLVSDVGGLAELVAAGAARGVAPGDAGALRGALSELLADRRALEALADAALTAAARRYGWDAIARQTLELYR